MLGHGTVAPASVPTVVEGALRTEKCVWTDGGQDHTVVVTGRGQVWAFGSGGAHAGTDLSSAVSNCYQTFDAAFILYRFRFQYMFVAVYLCSRFTNRS